MKDPWLVLPLAAVATAVVAWALARSGLAGRLSDVPNERSLHGQPVPRVGGIAMMVVALPLAAWGAGDVAILLSLAGALAVLSAADDIRSLPIGLRLSAHAAAALIAVLQILAVNGIEWAAAPVVALAAVLAVAWMTNLFNFMDGSDGLAGGMAAAGFGAYAAGAFAAGEPGLAWTSAALACAAVGFLLLNVPPARVFMGDAGSIPCGFLAGALGFAGVVRGAWPGWFPVLVFSPFIADATVTLVRRLLRGAPVWRAHREHAYQRLVLAGWSKRRLALAAWTVMAAAAGSAVLGRTAGATTACVIIVVWAAFYALILVAVERRCAATPRKAPSGGFEP